MSKPKIISIIALLLIAVGMFSYFKFFSSHQQVSSGTYTADQVAKHNNESDCWTSINGNVYNVTSWINIHPGGPDKILSLCGKDGTEAFTTQHRNERKPARELEAFLIGTLK